MSLPDNQRIRELDVYLQTLVTGFVIVTRIKSSLFQKKKSKKTVSAKNRYNFSIHGVANFSLSGQGPLFEYMTYQYTDFLETNAGNFPHQNVFAVKVASAPMEPDYTQVITMGNEKFARATDGNGFIWSVKNKVAMLDGQKPLAEQMTLSFDPSFNKMKANVLCELFWRFRFAQKKVALVHAACVANDNEAILLPAWKNVGKTATCLKLVAAGSDFLADDRLWLRSDGIALSFPRYVVLKDSNIEHFPEISSIITKAKLHALNLLARMKWLESMSLFKRIRQRLIPAQYFHIKELYSASRVLSQSKISTVVQLVKSKSNVEVKMHLVDSQRSANTISNIGDVEWNHSLMTLVSAHDTFFPGGPCWSQELTELMDDERQIVKGALSSLQCHELSLPEEGQHLNWTAVTQKLLGQ
ncbi:hypothetical protein [Methylophaga thiooxydans]|uniref:hypothetical protein n=1 Tax=Methylophaga thiooxydans TaxID=392484 RepID=UPI0023547C8F|nr:hypothetical protein [Methylophaga thiooxydans]